MANKFPSKERQQGLLDLTDYICERALYFKATAASVTISNSEGHDLSFADGRVESLEFKGGYDISVSIYMGKKIASFSTSDSRRSILDSAISSLCNKITYLEEDPHVKLPEQDLLAYDYKDLQLYYPWDISIPEQIAYLKECEMSALAVSSKIKQCESVSLNCSSGYLLFANSHGLRAAYSNSYYNLSISLLASDKNRSMHRDYAYTLARNPAAMASANDVAVEAANKTLARIGARSIKSQKSRVLFSPRTAKSLIGCFLHAISGGSIYRRVSFLQDCIEKKVFSDFVNIIDDPFIIAGIGSSYCDSEGVATAKRPLVKDGVLQGYLLNTYTASQLGMRSTGNAGGAHNVCVDSSSGDLQHMMKELGTGLYVTELMGQGTNMLTGDFSKGVFGYWVVGGVISHPVHEVTIAANLKNIFRDLVAIGSDVDVQGAVRTGSWLVEEMTIAG
ncbi:MAG: metalloprotease PmbA [Legionellales bacterium]|jgi:PmbA protein|nr:metalloprotease PmbA [Legionellales bacterium]